MATFERDNRTIGYQITGEGEPILAFHGTTQAGNAWDQVIQASSQPRQWIVFEFPGSGESSMPTGPLSLDDIVDDAAALMNHLGHEKYHVAGYSLGAVAALHFAARHSATTKTVTSLCGWARSDARMRATFQLWRDLIAISPELFMRYAIVDGYTVGTIEMLEPMLDQVIAMAAIAVQPGSDAHLELDMRVDVESDLTLISAPCLVLGGEQDRWVDISHSQYLATSIAGAQLHVLPAGHLVISEGAADIASLIDSHTS